jgi:hypothetical protein
MESPTRDDAAVGASARLAVGDGYIQRRTKYAKRWCGVGQDLAALAEMAGPSKDTQSLMREGYGRLGGVLWNSRAVL